MVRGLRSRDCEFRGGGTGGAYSGGGALGSGLPEPPNSHLLWHGVRICDRLSGRLAFGPHATARSPGFAR